MEKDDLFFDPGKIEPSNSNMMFANLNDNFMSQESRRLM